MTTVKAGKKAKLPVNTEELAKVVAERTADVDGRLLIVTAILNALDFPVVRTNADDTMSYINNAFFEYAEVPELMADGKTGGDVLRALYTGKSVRTYLHPEDFERFEGLKEKAKRRRFTDAQAKFVVGVKGEFTFVSHAGRETPVHLSVTYAVKYDQFTLNFVDISELKQAQENLRQAHDELELRVLERTAELQEASEKIRRQAEAIMELSTPVIRLWKGIVLMPLIGVIDTSRSSQMTDRLLHTISESGAEVAILDVTGVPVIDTSVARHLIGTVASAKILGADVVITGFSPATAQTLIQLGVDFSQLRTRGTLQSGIAEAFALVGRKVVER